MTTTDEPPRRTQQLPPPMEPPYDPEYDRLRTPPTPTDAAQEAERAFVAHLLTNPATAATDSALLDPADYYQPRHQVIHEAIAAVAATGLVPDHVALLGHLQQDPDKLRRAGGHHYLLSLRDAAPALPQLEHYTQLIRDAAGLRRLDKALVAMRQRISITAADQIPATLAELSDLADQVATNFGPTTAATNTTGLHDLGWILTGTPPEVPPPTVLHRGDGHALFYPGKVNGIFGDPEGGKTWLAQCAIVEALNNGGTGAMIDVDHNGPNHTAARLLLLGARLEHIADPTRFRYYEPEDGDQLLAAVTETSTWVPEVLLIDSLGEIFPMLGVNTNDGDEITTAMRKVCTRPATAGSCVITIDHLPKSAEARTSGYAIGSIAKKRMIRGAYLRADVKVQPAPGAKGLVTLRIEKDTAGELRKSSGGGYAGTLTLDSTQPHITTWSIDREEMPKNDDGTFRPTNLMEQISKFIEDNDQCTFTEIKEAVQGKDKWLRDSIKVLVHEGFVARFEGARRAQHHHSVAPYRITEDDHAA